MSVPAPSTTSALSPTGSFSVISSVDSHSRSASPSYQDVDGTASLSQSFSELSSSVSIEGAPRVASASEDEDDEFILIPTGSNMLNLSLQSHSPSVVVPAAAESTSRMATPFVGHRQTVQPEEENDAEDEEEDNASASEEDDHDDDDARNEEDARARQRMLRSQDLAEDADSGSDDDVVLATAGRMGDLSISHRAPSALSVRTLTYLAAATPVPSQPILLPPTALFPVVQPQPASAPSDSSRTSAQLEARRLKKQRAKARRRERLQQERQQQSLSDSGSSTAGGHSSDRSMGNTAYDDAVAFITKYIANPPQQPSVAVQLRLLQSIITELGFLTGKTSMPQSIKACKKLIKQCVHINVKDYLARRLKQVEVAQNSTAAKKTVQVGAGVTELKKLLFPNKAALMQSLKANKKKVMSRQAIKKAGLNVFMVVVFH